MNFLRAFLNDLKRRVISPSFWIMTLLAAAAYIASSAEELKFAWNSNTADVLYFWDMAHNIGYFTSISLLCCTAINCTSFLNDYHSFYYRSAALRSGKRNYALSKYLSCVVTGGLTLALGLVLVFLIMMIRFPFISENSGALDSWLHSNNFGSSVLADGNYFSFAVIYAFLAFLFGAVWSAVGVCVSAFVTDKYVASFSPYVIWYVTGRLLNGISRGIFRTEVIFRGNYNVGGTAGSLLFAVGYLGAVIAVLGVIFCIKACRRCADQ